MEESSSSNSSVHAQIIGSKPKRPRSFRKTKHTLDHISPLHDSILHHILSFLAAEAAIKTSVLSKRWNRLWTFASDLSFYNRRGVARVPDFVAFVCKALELYSSSGKLDKFLVDFEYKTNYASEVNKWVCFATTHKVEKLYLEFETSGSSYLLPRRLRTSSTFKILSLRFCHFTKKPTICWASLKVLWIGYARLSHDMMQNILLGSPALTELRLYNFVFRGYKVVITSTSLKKLELVGDKVLANNDDDSAIVEISAPNLQSLNISRFMNKKRFQLTDVLSLVEAKLSYERIVTEYGRNSCYMIDQIELMGLLLKLPHVPKLTISTWCLKILTILKVQTWPSPLAKRKTLVLDTQLDRWDLPGIANLLQSSPYLEKLVINLVPSYNSKFEFPPDYTDGNFDHEEYWQSKDMTFGPLPLKTVEIIGFEARCVGLKFVPGFVQFLLKHARVLEKMIIYGKRDDLNHQILTLVEACQLLQVTQLFLSYQRSSPNVVVLFS